MKSNLLAASLVAAAFGCIALFGSALGLELSSLSNADASAGLKKALDQGINQAVGKLGVAELQDVVGDRRFTAPPTSLDAARRNRVFTPDTAALDDAPA